MNNKSFQQQVNDISAYSQINKAFRHAYGSPTAAVLATLIYKYNYWEANKGLLPISTVNGSTLKHFHISKLDISIDSDVSISSLEKNSENNPLFILERLKLIQIITPEKANKSDRFILYPNRIKAEIIRVSKLLDEDMEMIKELPRKDKRVFYKALRGKLTREEVYEKFSMKLEDFDLNLEDFEENSQHPASNEADNSSNEGRTKNSTKNITKNTNPSSSKRGAIPMSNQQTTSEELEEGLQLYYLKEITTQQMFGLLTRYIPNKVGYTWNMSPEDESYIKHNLSGVSSEYMDATIEYIDTNVARMISGDRKMRFGSMLAGILVKVVEAGIGAEPEYSISSKAEHKKMIGEAPDEIHFDFENQL
ncbi:MAG: hypothetical protein ACI82E_000267 [Nonlabens sp.]|jgi:hypothetical protein